MRETIKEGDGHGGKQLEQSWRRERGRRLKVSQRIYKSSERQILLGDATSWHNRVREQRWGMWRVIELVAKWDDMWWMLKEKRAYMLSFYTFLIWSRMFCYFVLIVQKKKKIHIICSHYLFTLYVQCICSSIHRNICSSVYHRMCPFVHCCISFLLLLGGLINISLWKPYGVFGPWGWLEPGILSKTPRLVQWVEKPKN